MDKLPHTKERKLNEKDLKHKIYEDIMIIFG